MWAPGEWVVLLRHTLCKGEGRSQVYSSQEAIVVERGPWHDIEHTSEFFPDGYAVNAREVVIDVLAPGGALGEERTAPIRRVKVLEVGESLEFKNFVHNFHAMGKDVYKTGDVTTSRKIHREANGLEDRYTEMISGYVLTTHRSQGSTHDEVFVDLGDIIENCPNWEDKLRAIYVGATRARHSVVLGCDEAELKKWKARALAGKD